MRRSVQHGHVSVNPGEERREVDPEVVGQKGERWYRGHDATLLHGGHEGAAQRPADFRLTETLLNSKAPELQADSGGEARASRTAGLFRNS